MKRKLEWENVTIIFSTGTRYIRGIPLDKIPTEDVTTFIIYSIEVLGIKIENDVYDALELFDDIVSENMSTSEIIED